MLNITSISVQIPVFFVCYIFLGFKLNFYFFKKNVKIRTDATGFSTFSKTLGFPRIIRQFIISVLFRHPRIISFNVTV